MHVNNTQGFGKHERLCRKNDIQELFTRGSSFYFTPLRVKYYRALDADSHQVLVSVPKRLFKKAVDRNRVKRRIKEAFRRQKNHIRELEPLHMAFIVGKQTPVDQQAIDRAVHDILTKLLRDELDNQH